MQQHREPKSPTSLQAFERNEAERWSELRELESRRSSRPSDHGCDPARKHWH